MSDADAKTRENMQKVAYQMRFYRQSVEGGALEKFSKRERQAFVLVILDTAIDAADTLLDMHDVLKELREQEANKELLEKVSGHA